MVNTNMIRVLEHEIHLHGIIVLQMNKAWIFALIDLEGFPCFFAHSCFARCMACERELPKKNTCSENHRRWSQIMASGKQTEMSLRMKKMVRWLTAEISFLRDGLFAFDFLCF